MASIVKRNKTYSVIYYYFTDEGQRKQKWETFNTYKKAMQRKAEVEYLKLENIFPSIKTVVASCAIKTVEIFVNEYIGTYGKNNWSISTYTSNKSLVNNYVVPYIGKIPIHIITTAQIEEYYGQLADKKIITRVHKFLKSMFNQAHKLKIISENPFSYISLPKSKYVQKTILTAEQIKELLAYLVDKDYQLYMCVSLSFACSLRLGEILGLTWEDVDVANKSLQISKTLARANLNNLKELNNKDVIHVFQPQFSFKKSRLILKAPKTHASHRQVWLPEYLMVQLYNLKNSIYRELYSTNQFLNKPNLLFINKQGEPVDLKSIEDRFKDGLIHCGLPQVTFHSLRHSSITYKLLLTNGDVKSVQGDSGHSQIDTTMNIYAHILDDKRKNNAVAFNNFFYKEALGKI